MEPNQKDILTVKDMRELGYPDKMIRQLAHMPGNKSVMKKPGKTSTIYFIRALLLDDVIRYKEINNL